MALYKQDVSKKKPHALGNQIKLKNMITIQCVRFPWRYIEFSPKELSDIVSESWLHT